MSMYRSRGLIRKIEFAFFVMLGIFVFVIFFAAGNVMRGKYQSGAEQIKDDARVLENASLAFDLSIGYEEVAKIVDAAAGSIVVDVRDRIPEGLKYVDASVLESDKYRCAAELDGGFDYDDSQKALSFRVRMPSLDCGLVLRVYTWTPVLEKGLARQDFYNYAYLTSFGKTVISNYEHVFIGEPNVALYEVAYKYTDEVPEGAAELPREEYYAVGAKVGLAPWFDIDGYGFSGWYVNGEMPKDGYFVMPKATTEPTGVFFKK